MDDAQYRLLMETLAKVKKQKSVRIEDWKIRTIENQKNINSKDLPIYRLIYLNSFEKYSKGQYKNKIDLY